MVLDVESIEETLCSFHFIWIYVFSHALVLLGLIIYLLKFYCIEKYLKNYKLKVENKIFSY